MKNYKKKYKNRKFNYKQLLVPLTFNFSETESVEIKNNENYFKEIGVNLLDFGDNTFILREYPDFMYGDIKEIILKIINKIIFNKNFDFINLINEIIAMAACKMSIKANDILVIDEMKELIKNLYSCENPFTCPHGRPVISKLSKKDLEKMFKRII